MQLQGSFYVKNNCVTSVENETDLFQFITDTKCIMCDVKFDLRGWKYTDPLLSLNVNNVMYLV